MIRAFTFIVALLVLAGCASREEAEQKPAPPAPQRTVVEAEPIDAQCRAIGRVGRRDAQPAPLTIDPRQLGFPVEVTCIAPGYFPTTEILHPRPLPNVMHAAAERHPFSAMADLQPAAGAPADSTVAFRITVPLRAMLFDTPGARDAFYEDLRRGRAARWEALRRQAETDCARPETSRAGASATTPPEICRRAYNWLSEQRDADLRRLEIDRRRATFR